MSALDYTTEAQTYAEELLNTIIHGTGLMVSIPAAILLVCLARRHGNLWHVIGCGLYGASLVMMYTFSTLYHWSGIADLFIPSEKLRDLDHCAVFFLIAGTYTPLTLINVIYNNTYTPARAKTKEATRAVLLGWVVLGIVWSMCIIGVTVKLMFGSDGVRPAIGYSFYMIMGYAACLGGSSFLRLLPKNGLKLLVIGGMSYSIGIVFLLVDTIPFNHPVWHLFVGAGSILHYFSVIACAIEIPAHAVKKKFGKSKRSKVLDSFTRFAYANFCKNTF